MRRVPFLLVVLAAGLIGLIQSQRAAAQTIYITGDHYAAIAYSPSTGNVGWSYNCSSRCRAECLALSQCNASDAKVVVWVKNGFAALALGPDRSTWGTGYTSGVGSREYDAARDAFIECDQYTEPTWMVIVCTEDVKPKVRGSR